MLHLPVKISSADHLDLAEFLRFMAKGVTAVHKDTYSQKWSSLKNFLKGPVGLSAPFYLIWMLENDQ